MPGKDFLYFVLLNLLFHDFVDSVQVSIEIIGLGETTILKCQQKASYWKRGNAKIMDDGGVIVEGFNKTFEMINITGHHDLRIKEITFNEKGTYKCFVDDVKEEALIEVIVVDKNITCNIPTLIGNANKDQILNCSFKSSGNCDEVPWWVSKESNENLTSNIDYGYVDGYFLLVANEDILKGGIWLRVIFNCNISSWRNVKKIYDEFPLIEFSSKNKVGWLQLFGYLAIMLSMILFLYISTLVINAYRKYGSIIQNRNSTIRNRPLPGIPTIRYIRNSLVEHLRRNVASTIQQHSINVAPTIQQHSINVAPTIQQHSINVASTIQSYSTIMQSSTSNNNNPTINPKNQRWKENEEIKLSTYNLEVKTDETNFYDCIKE